MKKIAITVILILFSNLSFGAGNDSKVDESEDMLIIKAFLYQNEKNYSKSQEIFLQLYSMTNQIAYLVQASKEAMMYRGGEVEVIKALEKYLSNNSKLKNLAPARMVIALYAKIGDIKRADEFGTKYLSKSNSVDDMRLIATIKTGLRKYKESLQYLEKAYRLKPNDKVLLDEVNIIEKKLLNSKRAIKLIKKHIKRHSNISMPVYFKLIELYSKRKDYKNVLEIYKKLYKREPQRYFLQKIIKLSILTNKINDLIKFLEKNSKGNEELLYMLYKEKNRFDKAMALANKKFKETKDPKWLAEKAILIYEKGNAKGAITPKLLKRFQKIFDKALKLGVKKGIYLNYYGYILIDHDLDVERGLKLVTLALKEKPNNTFYLDSLAWGLYKLGECIKAYKIMKRVIAQEGILKENEIRSHWESIRECNKLDGSEMF